MRTMNADFDAKYLESVQMHVGKNSVVCYFLLAQQCNGSCLCLRLRMAFIIPPAYLALLSLQNVISCKNNFPRLLVHLEVIE